MGVQWQCRGGGGIKLIEIKSLRMLLSSLLGIVSLMVDCLLFILRGQDSVDCDNENDINSISN